MPLGDKEEADRVAAAAALNICPLICPHPDPDDACRPFGRHHDFDKQQNPFTHQKTDKNQTFRCARQRTKNAKL